MLYMVLTLPEEDKIIRRSTFLIHVVLLFNTCNPHQDSSSLTNEKDHHYFLNSADVCW